MNNATNKKRAQKKIARLEIVGKMYKRGHSYRQIQAEVMRRLDLSSYSLETVSRDVKTLLAEWRGDRLDNVDEALQLELERIDEAVAELWEQWEKSKEDGVKRTRKKRASKGDDGSNGGGRACEERFESEEIRSGNPAYISEIRQQLMERRRLLGLYSPDKQEVKVNTPTVNREELVARLRRLEALDD